MTCFRLLMLAAMAGLAGCAISYSLVAAGPVLVQDLSIQAGAGWNRAPGSRTPAARNGAETWTRDGLLLDRLVISPAIPDGQAIVVSRSESAALPIFRADMLPNELEELIESSMVKFFGEGNAVVSTANLRPHRYGEISGVRFDLDVTVTDGPPYKGTVGAFIANESLYLMYFLGAVPYYYDKHIDEAAAIIASARLLGGTIN